MNLSTYLRAGYPGLAIISSEEARAEAEIAAVCTSLKRNLHAWSSTDNPLILASQFKDLFISDRRVWRNFSSVGIERHARLHLSATESLKERCD